MPTENSFPHLSRALISLLQFGGANVFNSDRLHPEVLVDGIKNKLLGGYNGVQHAVYRYISQDTSNYRVDHESAPDSNRQVTKTSRGHPFHNQNNPFISEADKSGRGASQTDAAADYTSRGMPTELPLERSKRPRVWVAVLVFGVLSLIVLPGLVVGFITKQVSWGVELSGAIAPIVSLLAGLYYHHNK